MQSKYLKETKTLKHLFYANKNPHFLQKLMKADATSCFSAYIAASLGYLAESEIDYNSIGFPVEKPHEKLKIMCKNLGD